MANRIRKHMEEWQQKDNLLLAHSGGDQSILKNREYMRQKFRETRNFMRLNKGNLNYEEKAWMTMLKVGNKHLERKLYPNPLTRYARRAVNSMVNFWKDRRTAKPIWDGGLFPPSVKYMPDTIKSNSVKTEKKITPTVNRLVQKNKYAALNDLNNNKGLSVKR